MHQQQLIMDATVAKLIAAATPAGSRVYADRTIPWAETELPAISVYDLSESVDSDSEYTAPRRLTRHLSLAIQVGVQVKEGSVPSVDTVLRSYLEQIEYAIESDDQIGGTCSLALISDTSKEFKEMGRKQIGFLFVTFDIRYNTWAPEIPNPALGTLSVIDTHYNLNDSQQTEDQAEDTITVDQ